MQLGVLDARYKYRSIYVFATKLGFVGGKGLNSLMLAQFVFFRFVGFSLHQQSGYLYMALMSATVVLVICLLSWCCMPEHELEDTEHCRDHYQVDWPHPLNLTLPCVCSISIATLLTVKSAWKESCSSAKRLQLAIGKTCKVTRSSSDSTCHVSFLILTKLSTGKCHRKGAVLLTIIHFEQLTVQYFIAMSCKQSPAFCIVLSCIVCHLISTYKIKKPYHIRI